MYRELRHWTHQLFAPHLGGRPGIIVDWFIMILIAVNVVAVMLETVGWIYADYATELQYFEMISVAIFTVEYLGRVWSAIEDPRFDGPISGRVKFASRPLAVIDLLAILPFYLTAVGLHFELRYLRALRLIRFFRLFKLARYNESMRVFSRVIRTKRETLVVALIGTFLVWIVASSLMFYIEHSAQPEVFSSIPATLWWGIITLTTVGYGDTYPVTALGKVFGGLVALLGIGLVALPASILASGFIEEAVDSEDDATLEYCPCCGEDLDQYR